MKFSKITTYISICVIFFLFTANVYGQNPVLTGLESSDLNYYEGDAATNITGSISITITSVSAAGYTYDATLNVDNHDTS